MPTRDIQVQDRNEYPTRVFKGQLLLTVFGEFWRKIRSAIRDGHQLGISLIISYVKIRTLKLRVKPLLVR